MYCDNDIIDFGMDDNQEANNCNVGQGNFSTNQENFSTNQENFSTNQENFSTNQENFSTNQENFSTNQGNPPMNQGNFSTNQGNTPIKRTKKRKKRRKHRLLKFILLVCIIVLFIYCNNQLAKKEMLSFVSEFPFEFSNDIDNLNYITSDFKVTTTYTYNNKEYNVEWKTDNNCIEIDDYGNVIVSRQNNNETVTLRQIYRKFLGKYEIKYTINVIGTDCLNINDIEIVTVEQVANNEYSGNMQAVLNEDGSLQFMMGDFLNTKVKSVDDALVVLQAYKEQFGLTNENITFELNYIDATNSYTSYCFDLYLDNFKLNNDKAFVVTNTATNDLVKVSIDCDNANISNIDNSEVNHSELIANHIRELEGNDCELIVVNYPAELSNDGVIYKYHIITSNNNLYDLEIVNNTITYSNDSLDSLYNDDIYDFTIATGVNELGEELEFEAAIENSTWEHNTILYDMTRNISAVDNSQGTFNATRKGIEMVEDDNILGMFVALYGILVETPLQLDNFSLVTSENGEYTSEEAVAVQTYYNMQRTYDFYSDVLGIYSYDNRGSEIRLYVDNTLNKHDNAAWYKVKKVIVVAPAEFFRYQVAYRGEVIAHEFTHGIFNEKLQGTNTEVSGLNEAYADIFGCLAFPEANWQMCLNYYAFDCAVHGISHKEGDMLVGRDLININSDISLSPNNPETYRDTNWYNCGEESHDISIMISNIAYKMSKSGYFTDEQLAHIWYNSILFGYDENSTYVTNRKYVIAAAEDMGFDKEVLDFIALCYDEAHIYDNSYEYSTDLNNLKTEITSDGTITLVNKDNSIDGDVILDNTTSRRFLVVKNDIELAIGQGTIVIYEESSTNTNDTYVNDLKNQLEELVKAKYGENITVEYKVVNSTTFEMLADISNEAPGAIKNFVIDSMDNIGIELSEDDEDMVETGLENFIPMIFNYKIYEDTSYNFYRELGLIE